MKFQNLLGLEKHLEGASPNLFSPIYLVVAPCPIERRRIAEKIAMAINLVLTQEEEFEVALGSLNTLSLFGDKQLIFCDGIDKLKKDALSAVGAYADAPSPFSYLVLGSSSSKGLNDLCSKKDVIACDLGDEKPWDRKERLKRTLLQSVSKAKKNIRPDAMDHLLENVGLNLPALEQEIEKLITFVGDGPQITLKDVLTLCQAQKSLLLWQLADAIVWQDQIPKTEEMNDLSQLLPLMTVLRNQLQQGLEICTLLEQGCPSHAVAGTLSHLKPAFVQKALPLVAKRKSPFFKSALNVLFDVEMMAKNSSLDPSLLFDLITCKLTHLKRS